MYIMCCWFQNGHFGQGPHKLKESLNAKTDKVVTMAVVELAAVAVAKAAVMGILCFTACCRGNQAKTAILDMTYNS